MSRVRSLPTWMLRLVLKLPATRSMWGAAWIELWRRDVLETMYAATNDESGPWACAPIRGVH